MLPGQAASTASSSSNDQKRNDRPYTNKSKTAGKKRTYEHLDLPNIPAAFLPGELSGNLADRTDTQHKFLSAHMNQRKQVIKEHRAKDLALTQVAESSTQSYRSKMASVAYGGVRTVKAASKA